NRSRHFKSFQVSGTVCLTVPYAPSRTSSAPKSHATFQSRSRSHHWRTGALSRCISRDPVAVNFETNGGRRSRYGCDRGSGREIKPESYARRWLIPFVRVKQCGALRKTKIERELNEITSTRSDIISHNLRRLTSTRTIPAPHRHGFSASH